MRAGCRRLRLCLCPKLKGAALASCTGDQQGAPWLTWRPPAQPPCMGQSSFLGLPSFMPLRSSSPLTSRSPSLLGVAFAVTHDFRVPATRVVAGVVLDLKVIAARVRSRPSSARHGRYVSM
eukprot:CAMPEP_0172547314 /NCGR_PEP_ID=MMETSP1067-20121228/16885_1 /TAXON_ID=265564 ORGANISM="Thalassiosira punctigera, Strain Tpunct2005C2" /NCGR_SAMPLE_ID=MMETSP1067 /ASSEMBLY_ACC=CAM_ASM_000444 /LENGTH=120 /DNA_ID=CAMNT_0013334391 /DNA_START=57 /DNA_END=420 /DNA_ORIENTATION=-